MRVFVAGASGVIGVRLLPLLVEAGHEVAGMTRSPEKVELLRRLGALPVVCDVFDRPALREAVIEFAPEAVVSELTDLPDDRERLHAFEAANDRMRREGHATCSMRRRLPRPHGFWPRASPGNFPASEAQPSTSSSGRCSRLAASCCATASCTGLELLRVRASRAPACAGRGGRRSNGPPARGGVRRIHDHGRLSRRAAALCPLAVGRLDGRPTACSVPRLALAGWGGLGCRARPPARRSGASGLRRCGLGLVAGPPEPVAE